MPARATRPTPASHRCSPPWPPAETAATLSALTDVVRRTHSADLDRIKAEMGSFGEIAPDKRDYVLSLLDQVPFVVGKAMVSTLDSDQRQRLAQLSDRDHQRHPAAAVAVLAALKTDEIDALGDELAKGRSPRCTASSSGGSSPPRCARSTASSGAQSSQLLRTDRR